MEKERECFLEAYVSKVKKKRLLGAMMSVSFRGEMMILNLPFSMFNGQKGS